MNEISLSPPRRDGTSILEAMKRQNFPLAELVMKRFPDSESPLSALLSAMSRDIVVLPWARACMSDASLSDVFPDLCNIVSLLEEKLELLQYCVSSFSEYNNTKTTLRCNHTNVAVTLFHEFLSEVLFMMFDDDTKEDRMWQECSLVRVFSILISNAAVIIPPILPVPPETRPEWGKKVKERLLLHFPDVLATLII